MARLSLRRPPKDTPGTARRKLEAEEPGNPSALASSAARDTDLVAGGGAQVRFARAAAPSIRVTNVRQIRNLADGIGRGVPRVSTVSIVYDGNG